MSNLDFNKKISLLKIIRELRNNKLSWKKILRELTIRQIIPKEWETEEKPRKFYSRCKNLLNNDQEKLGIEIDIFEFIRPMIKNVHISEYDKFNIFWKKLTDSGKSKFLDWLAHAYMNRGIMMSDICTNMVNDFNRMGILYSTEIRNYISNKFKNNEMLEINEKKRS